MPAPKSFKKRLGALLLLVLPAIVCLAGFNYWRRQQPEYYLGKAQAAAAAGDRDHQEFYLLQLVRLTPENVDAHVALAEIYREDAREKDGKRAQGADVKAVEHLRAAVDLRPESAPLQARLMVAYDRAGRAKAAMQTADRVVSLEPGHELALSLLAADALKSKSLESAKKLLQAVPREKWNSRYVYLRLRYRVARAASDRASGQAVWNAALDRVAESSQNDLARVADDERRALEELLVSAVEEADTLDEAQTRLTAAFRVLETLGDAHESIGQQQVLAQRATQLLMTLQKRHPLPKEVDQTLAAEHLALLRRFEVIVRPALDSLKAPLQVYSVAARAAHDCGHSLLAVETVRQTFKAHPRLSAADRSDLLKLEAASVQQLVLRGKFGDAKLHLKELIDDDEMTAWSHFAAGYIAEQEERLADAEASYTAARKVSAEHIPVNVALMNVRYQLGHYQAVEPLLADLNARWDRLSEQEVVWIERRLGGRDGVRLAQMRLYLALERYADALKQGAALAGTPWEAKALQSVVRYHTQRNEQEQAANLLKNLQARYPKDEGTILCEAEMALQFSQPDVALDTVRRCLLRLPGHPLLLEARIVLHCKLQQWFEAQETALLLAGKTPSPSRCLGLARMFLRAERFGEARDWAEQAENSARSPYRRARQLMLAEINRREGAISGNKRRLAEARDLYLEILKDDPENIGVANNLVWLWGVDLGEPRQTLGLLRKLRDRHGTRPLSLEVMDTLVTVYFKAGELDEARSLAESALQNNPKVATLHLKLGQIHARAGRVDAARAALGTALTLGLPEPLAAEARAQLKQLESA